MCNFIIRPIKSYATVDVFEDRDTQLISAGDEFKVERIEGDTVVGMVNGSAGLAVPLNVYLHSFSDKKPEDKKAKESKEPKKD